MTDRITKREAERLMNGVAAVGDDPDALRALLAEWVPTHVLAPLDLDALFDLAARLNEERIRRS